VEQRYPQEGRLAASTTVEASNKNRKMELKTEIRMNASTTRPKMASSTRENSFCAQIDKILVQVDIKGLTGAEKRTENVINREEKREESRTKIDLHREENDIKRKTQLEELTRRATTTEQKAAVLAFTTIVEKALSDKKIALDALLLAHRNEVDKITASRKIIIEKAITLLRADIEAVKTKAKLDCTSGVAGDSVRTTLKDSIQKSQQTFRITMQSLEKDTLSLKRESKKEELRAIEMAFKKSVEQAKNNLKTALTVKASASATN
jgi:hypothetical protein